MAKRMHSGDAVGRTAVKPGILIIGAETLSALSSPGLITISPVGTAPGRLPLPRPSKLTRPARRSHS